MADNTPYLAFLKDPDQVSRRAELAAFFGPHAETFLKTYDKLREDTVRAEGGRPKFRFFGGGFEAAAFFLGPVWFFYRKMWVMAWVVVALLVVAAVLPIASRIGLILSVLLGFLGHRTYVQHAIGKLQTMRLADGTLDPVSLREAGGVSKPAGIVSGTIFGLMWVVGIVAIVYLAMHGIGPR